MSFLNLMVVIVNSIAVIFAVVAMSAGSRKIKECKEKLKECEERNPQEYKKGKIESNPLKEELEKKKVKADVQKIEIVVLSIVAIFAFIYAYHLQMNADKSTQQIPLPQEQNTPQVDEYGNPIIKGYGIEIENWSWSICDYDHGYVNVEGKVKNISGKKLSGVMAVVDFYDRNGKYIETERSFIDDNPILPNQISPFTVFCSHDPAMYKAGLSFKFSEGGKIPSKSK